MHDSLERVSDQLSVNRMEVQVCSSGCVSFSTYTLNNIRVQRTLSMLFPCSVAPLLPSDCSQHCIDWRHHHPAVQSHQETSQESQGGGEESLRTGTTMVLVLLTWIVLFNLLLSYVLFVFPEDICDGASMPAMVPGLASRT